MVVTKYKTESSLLLTEERTKLCFTNTQDIMPLCMASSLEPNPHPHRHFPTVPSFLGICPDIPRGGQELENTILILLPSFFTDSPQFPPLLGSYPESQLGGPLKIIYSNSLL